MSIPSKPLSNIQLELLQLYATDIPEQDLLEIKQLLAHYFAAKATEAMDALWEEKNLTEEDMHDWANGHLRASKAKGV